MIDAVGKVVLPGFSQYAHDRPGIGYRLRIGSQRAVVQSGRGDELQPVFWIGVMYAVSSAGPGVEGVQALVSSAAVGNELAN